MNRKYVGPTVSIYELSKHPLHLLMKPIQVGFFLFGVFIISWCNTATSFECSWIWIRMHACVMQHRQSVPFYAAIKEKKTCVSRTFCEMWGFMGFFHFQCECMVTWPLNSWVALITHEGSPVLSVSESVSFHVNLAVLLRLDLERWLIKW